MDNDDELCPCGSGKPFLECCQKEYDEANQEVDQAELARKRIKDAMGDPQKAQELKELLKQFKK